MKTCMKKRNALPFWIGLITSMAATACDVDDTDLITTGVNLREDPAAKARGFAVVSSDYESYNVSLLSLRGEVQSESVISSGSASAGLSAPLTDVVMPNVDGRQLGRSLATECPGVPVIYISAYPPGDMFSRDAPASAAFLQKPFSTEALQALVRSVLGATKVEGTP